ncbi:MAG: acyl--CoA ligase [Bryobacteraceae bacterium]|nr:acyl--CoA ligase [Bryobacteraceae bacterium]
MIADRLRRIVCRGRDSEALVDRECRITYGELWRRKCACAAILRDRLGLRAGDVLAVSLPNCWEVAAMFFAAAELGAIVMPFNTGWRIGEIQWFVSRFPIKAVVTNDQLRKPWDELPSPRPGVLAVDEPETVRQLGAAEVPADSRGARRLLVDEPALYLVTSGSTGKPKVVPRTHRNLVTGVTNVAAALALAPGQRLLAGVPFYHANGFNNCMFLPLATGATLALVRKFIPLVLLETLKRERVQVMISSPFLYSLLVDCAVDLGGELGLQTCISSGAPMSPALKERWQERFGVRVRQLYGSSETGVISIETNDASSMRGSVGRPIRGVEIRIASNDGDAQNGEILVRSPVVMSGYIDEMEVNRQIFQDGFFRTGDLGRLDEHNNIVISGRSKRMINVGGIKVDPAEIEDAIESIPGIERCRVTGERGARELELIKASIVARGDLSVSRADVVEHCRTRLAEYKIPRLIEFVESIAVDAAGKTPVEWRTNDGISGS